MPTFTVLTPHYGEKTLLSLRQIKYLKQPHPVEWENFVNDTMFLAEGSAMFNGVNPFANDEKGGSKTYDLPFYFIGFKSTARRKFTFVVSMQRYSKFKFNKEEHENAGFWFMLRIYPDLQIAYLEVPTSLDPGTSIHLRHQKPPLDNKFLQALQTP